MSDIVERLRDDPHDHDVYVLQREAADEITRLRAALQFYADWEGSKMFWDEGETARRALEARKADDRISPVDLITPCDAPLRRK